MCIYDINRDLLQSVWIARLLSWVNSFHIFLNLQQISRLSSFFSHIQISYFFWSHDWSVILNQQSLLESIPPSLQQTSSLQQVSCDGTSQAAFIFILSNHRLLSYRTTNESMITLNKLYRPLINLALITLLDGSALLLVVLIESLLNWLVEQTNFSYSISVMESLIDVCILIFAIVYECSIALHVLNFFLFLHFNSINLYNKYKLS